MAVQFEFKNTPLTVFLEKIERGKFLWLVKRLSGNDTGLTGGHQVGLYIPATFVKVAIPEICTHARKNPDTRFNVYFPNVDLLRENVRAVYYNGKHIALPGEKRSTRDEFRITQWGGRSSPIQNIDNTGSIMLLGLSNRNGFREAVCWVTENLQEEKFIEEWLEREVEPGVPPITSNDIPKYSDCWRFPECWKKQFPTGREIFDLVLEQIPHTNHKYTVDKLLLERRKREFELFSALENLHVFPRVEQGFKNVEEFIKFANSVSNRRKSRSGSSLELNLESILKEEHVQFDSQVFTENKKKPDFIFPSGEKYHSSAFPDSKLFMLAAKTCCKDRWRQIINEANRIKTKHLFTLQEGVSNNQLQEMTDENVLLVVPEPHKKSFHVDWRSRILSLQEFIRIVQIEQRGISREMNQAHLGIY